VLELTTTISKNAGRKKRDRDIELDTTHREDLKELVVQYKEKSLKSSANPFLNPS